MFFLLVVSHLSNFAQGNAFGLLLVGISVVKFMQIMLACLDLYCSLKWRSIKNNLENPYFE